MQKEKARSRQRMKALEDELSRMRSVQDGLSRKIKASNEVSHQSTTVTVRLVAHKTNSMQLLKASCSWQKIFGTKLNVVKMVQNRKAYATYT